MDFIELTSPQSGKKIAINVRNIDRFFESNGKTTIATSNGDHVFVLESYDFVKSAIMSIKTGGFTWKK